MADPTLFNYPVAPLPHVEIAREPDWSPSRRTRKRYRRLPDQPGNRADHAKSLADEAKVELERAGKAREACGIDPSRLLVLEFQSLDWDLLDELQDVFGATVVDERKGKDGDHETYTYLVQFESEVEFSEFEAELARYRRDESARGLLTAKQRTHFFDALQAVRLPRPEDRMGPRLRTEGMPAQGAFYLDVDLWHPGSRSEAQARVADIRTLCKNLGGQVTEDLSTNSMLLVKVLANPEIADALLTLDFVATVDRPPRLQAAYSGLFADSGPPPEIEPPGEDVPVACVIDSGVLSEHPLLAGWVGIEQAFIPLPQEGVSDRDGHGTSVAGLVVYGDVAECIETGRWSPRVRVHSAKILYHDGILGGAVFPESLRVESAIEKVIRQFASQHSCRVFNLSVGDEYQVYAGGRQFAWAEKLDELARELDVVIVVSAGNCTPTIPKGARTRAEFWEAVSGEMLNDGQRVCSPATASIAVAVGALARGDALGPEYGLAGVELKDAFACSPAGAPAPFSRTGPGYQVEQGRAAVKPELVHMGGNFGVRSRDGESPEWITNHVNLGEPTIRPVENGRYLTAKSGTSFSTPHVTHAAAVAERELELAMGRPASANLIRAVLGASAGLEECQGAFLDEEQERLRLVGYGFCDANRSAYSTQSRVTLVSEGFIGEDSLHVFALPLPPEFTDGSGKRGLRVSLAFDPPVRASRKEYLARTMWFEACRGLTVDDIEHYRAKVEAGATRESLPGKHHVDLKPSRRSLQWSTLQVASKEWVRGPRIPILEGESTPVFHILVGCQKRFESADPAPQRYGLAVTLWRQNEGVELYQAVRARIRARAIETRVRIDEARP